jgi:Secretion system C-terminal sorting domain
VPDFVEEKAIKSFSIFPNPANEQFNIQFNQQLDGDILITDISGKQCFREPINGRDNMNINTAALPKGTLLVSQLLGGKLIHTSRVIVN